MINAETIYHIEIMTVDGQILISKNMEQKNTISIPTDTWSNGMYLIRVIDDAGKQMHLEKLLKIL